MKVLILNVHIIFSPDVKAAFEQLGWQAEIFDALSREHLAGKIYNYRPNLVMTLGAPDYYANKPFIGQYLGMRGNQAGYRYIHWDTDGILGAYSHTLPFVLTSRPEITFTICLETLELLKANGLNAGIMKYGINPARFYIGNTNPKYSGMITYIAKVYDWVLNNRNLCKTKAIDTLVGALVKRYMRIDMWGDIQLHSLYMRWNRMANTNVYHGYCNYEALREIYQSCYINLVPQNSVYHVTKRTYDILGSGGFALAYDIPGIREEFEVGKEIIVVSTEEEVIANVNYYSSHIDEYNQIRMNGYKKVHEQYTYVQRLRSALGQIGL